MDLEVSKKLERPLRIKHFVNGMIIEDSFGQKVELEKVMNGDVSEGEIWKIKHLQSKEGENKV